MKKNRKIVRLSAEALIKMLGKATDLPADAKLVGITDALSFEGDILTLKIESATFPEVREGCDAPVLVKVVDLDRHGPEFL